MILFHRHDDLLQGLPVDIGRVGDLSDEHEPAQTPASIVHLPRTEQVGSSLSDNVTEPEKGIKD